MVASYRQPSSKQSNTATPLHAIDATSNARIFYAQNLHNSQIGTSDMNRRRRRRRSSFLLLELIFPELLEEPLARQLVVVVEQAA